MKKKNNIYQQGSVGAPTVFLAFAWVGIWFLYPSFESSVPEKSLETRNMVSYVHLGLKGSIVADPTVFGPNISARYSARGAKWRSPSDVVSSRRKSTKYLARDNYLISDDVGVSLPAIDDPEFLQLERFEPDIERDDAVYQYNVAQSARLNIQVEGGLKESGFQIHGLGIDDIDVMEESWQVVLFVDVQKNGHVKSVFLKSGCDNNKINEMIIKQVYRAVIENPKKGCSGQVTVSFGDARSRKAE